jgi:hypothetical protein
MISSKCKSVYQCSDYTSKEKQQKVLLLELCSPCGEYIAKYDKILNQSACGKLYIHLCNYTNNYY